AVAEYAERLEQQRPSHARLPATLFHRRHLLRDESYACEHETPRQLGGGVRRRTRVHVRGDNDAKPRARIDVDVWVHAALADQAQVGQAFEQRPTDLCALAYEHERFDV